MVLDDRPEWFGLPDTVTDLLARLSAAWATLRDRTSTREGKLRLLGRIAFASTLYIAAGIMPVAAQLGETSDALCGTGLEVLYALVATIVVLAGVIMGSIEGGRGFIKYDNPDPQVSDDGEDMIRSGLYSIFGPAAFFIFVTVAIEVTGFAIASCFIPELGLFGGGGGAAMIQPVLALLA